jgi:PAS domain S-box-containing protein
MDILKIRAITLFIVAIFNLTLVFILWYKLQKDKPRLWLGFSALFSGLYAFFCGATYFFWGPDLELSIFWYKTTWLGILMLPPFVIFTYYFNENTRRLKIKAAILYFLAFIIIFLVFKTDLFIKSLRLEGFTISSIAGNFDIIGRLYILLCLSWSLYNLLKNYFKAKDFRKLQLKYFIAGTLIFAVSGIITTSIVPYMIKESPFYDIAAYLSFIWIGLTTYAILKYNLLDVRVIATQLFALAVWFFLIVKVLLSANIQDFLINLSLLLSVIVFGYFLIRSVIKEVQQREKIERAKAEDEALLGSIGDGVVAIDKAGKVIFTNRAAEEMLGLKTSEMIGRPYQEVLQTETENSEKITEDKTPIYQALNFGKKVITDATEDKSNTILYYARKSGAKFPVAITAAPVILNNQTIGAINVFRDVTIERQVDKAKSEFVSLASHQLRTPLTAIRWYSEYLIGGKAGKLTKKQMEYMNEVYNGNQRMIKLINMMLNISRLEAGKIQVNKVSVDIEKLFEEIIKEQRFEAEAKKQKIIFESKDKLPQIFTDPALAREIFQNLLSNAIKYTPEGGKISCKLTIKNNALLFEIADNGIGIPESQQKNMFQKLFRADNASSISAQGTGLGLYGAKMTTERLGGKIWFESAEGKGTTFFVELPI